MVEQKLLTVGDVARVLRVSPGMVRNLIMRGDLASIKLGRSRRVEVSVVEAYLARLREEQGVGS